MTDMDSTISLMSSDITTVGLNPPKQPLTSSSAGTPTGIPALNKDRSQDPTKASFRPLVNSTFGGAASSAFRVNNASSGASGLLGKMNKLSSREHSMKASAACERREPPPNSYYAPPKPTTTDGAPGSDDDVLNELKFINGKRDDSVIGGEQPENTPQRDPEEQLPQLPPSAQQAPYASHSQERHHDERSVRRSITETTHPSAQFNSASRPPPEPPSHDLKHNDRHRHAPLRSRSNMESSREKEQRSSAAQVRPNNEISIPSSSQSLLSQPPPNQEEYMQRQWQHDYDRKARREEKQAIRAGTEAIKLASAKGVDKPLAETSREVSVAVSEKGAPTDPICLDDDEEDEILYDHEEEGREARAMQGMEQQADTRVHHSAKARADANAMPPPPPPPPRKRRLPPEVFQNGDCGGRQHDGQLPRHDGHRRKSGEKSLQQPEQLFQPPHYQPPPPSPRNQQPLPSPRRSDITTSNRPQPETPRERYETMDLTAEPKEVHYHTSQATDRRRQRAESEAVFRSIYENVTQQGSQHHGYGSSVQLQMLTLMQSVEDANKSLHESLNAAEREINYQKELATRARRDNIKLETEMSKYKAVLGTAKSNFNRLQNFVEGLGRDFTVLSAKRNVLIEGIKEATSSRDDLTTEMNSMRVMMNKHAQKMIERGDPLTRLHQQVTLTMDKERVLISTEELLNQKAGLLIEERARTLDLQNQLQESQQYAKQLLSAIRRLEDKADEARQEGTATLEIAKALETATASQKDKIRVSLTEILLKIDATGANVERIESGITSWLTGKREQDFTFFTSKHNEIVETLNGIRDAFSERSTVLVELSNELIAEIQKLASNEKLDSMSANIEENREGIVASIKRESEEVLKLLNAGNQKTSDAISALIEGEKIAQNRLVEELNGAKQGLEVALTENDTLKKLAAELRKEVDILHKAPLTEKDAYRTLEERATFLEQELLLTKQSKDAVLKEFDSLKLELKHERDRYEEAHIRISNFEKERSEHAGKIESNLKDERIQMETIARKLREAEQIKSENQIRILDAEIMELKEKLVKKQNEVDELAKLKDENEDIKKRFSESLEMATNHAKESSRLRDQLKGLEALEAERDKLQEELELAKQKITALSDEAALVIIKHEEEMQALEADKDKLSEQLMQLKQEISDSQRLVESEKTNNARVTTLQESLQARLAEVKEERDRLQCNLISEAKIQLELQMAREEQERLCKLHEDKIARLEADLVDLKNDQTVTKGREEQAFTEKCNIEVEISAADKIRELEEKDSHLKSVYEKYEKAHRQLLEAKTQKPKNERQKGSALINMLVEKLRIALNDFHIVAMRLWLDQEFIPDPVDLSSLPQGLSEMTSSLTEPPSSICTFGSDPPVAPQTTPTPTRSGAKIPISGPMSKQLPPAPRLPPPSTVGPVTRTQTRIISKANAQPHMSNSFGAGEVPKSTTSLRATPANNGSNSRILVRKGQRALVAPMAPVAPLTPTGRRKRLIDDDETSSQPENPASIGKLVAASPRRVGPVAKKKGLGAKRRRTASKDSLLNNGKDGKEKDVYEFDEETDRVESTPQRMDKKTSRRR